MRTIRVWIGNAWIRLRYPVQDESWPSRRWSRSRTDYCDMSG